MRVPPHIGTHLLEHILDLVAGLPDGSQQMLRVQAVGSTAIAGYGAGRSGIGHQRSDWRIHLRQPSLTRPCAAAKRVVAAGIQNHDVGHVASSLHLVKNRLRIDCAVGHLVFTGNSGAYRNQVVAPLDLHAVTRVIEQPGAPAAQPVTKLP